jgi:hypothetical protein
MNLRAKARPTHVLLLVVGLLIGMLTVGTAVALTSSSFKYSKPKTGKLSLSPSEFVPHSSGESYVTTWNPATTNGPACLATGIHLPNGSRIISIKFFYRSGASGDFQGLLYRQPLATGVSQELVNVHPADDSFTRKSVAHGVPSTKRTVANGTYAYLVAYCSAPDFGGAIVTYKYFNAGD